MDQRTEIDMTTKVLVEFEVADDSNEYKINKAINEFLRNSYREFANTHGIVDYEVKDGRVCTRRRNDDLEYRRSV